MAKGYPSKTRARKAFRRGFDAGKRPVPAKIRQPYRNPILAALWERGLFKGRSARRP